MNNGITLTGNRTLAVSGDSTLVLGGVISESGEPRSLTLSPGGTGTIRLSTANTHSGGTVLSGGMIETGNAQAFGTGTTTVGGATTLTLLGDTSFANDFVLNGDLTLAAEMGVSAAFNGQISGGSGLRAAFNVTPGTLTLTGNNTFTGGIAVFNQTTIIAGHDNALGTGTLDLQSNATLQASGAARTLANGVTLNNGNTLNVAGTQSLTLSGVVQGSGGITAAFDVGSESQVLTLAGTNTYTGPTAIARGVLAVDGSLLADSIVTVNSDMAGADATLRGVGTSGPVIVNSGGTVAPGNSIGTLNVQNSYTQQAGSTLQIEISDQVAGTIRTPVSDVLNVTGTPGTATLNGGTVAVSAIADNNNQTVLLTPGREYTFLTTSSGVSGQFANITDDNGGDLAFLTPLFVQSGDASFDENAVKFRLSLDQTNLASVASTANQTAVAQAIDGLGAGLEGDLANVLLELQRQPADAQRKALNQINGDMIGGLSDVAFLMNDSQWQLIGLQFRPEFGTGQGQTTASRRAGVNGLPNSLTGLDVVVRGQSPDPLLSGFSSFTPDGWTAGFGSGGRIDGDGNSPETAFDFGGTAIGMDDWIGENTRFGIAATIAWANVDSRRAGDALHVDFQDYALAAMFTHLFDRSYLIAGASYGLSLNESTRHIGFGTVNRTAVADFVSHRPSTYLEYGMNAEWGGWSMMPYTSLTWTYFGRQDFTETGAGGLNLHFNEQDSQSLRTNVGVAMRRPVAVSDNVELIPQLRISWRHEVLDDSAVANGSLPVGSTGQFGVQGAQLGRNALNLAPGIACAVSSNALLFIAYEAQLSSRHHAHGGHGGFQWVW